MREVEAEVRGYPIHSTPPGLIVGQSPLMQGLYRSVDRVASSSVTVLIHGESGTGKELVARALHYNGRTNGRPLPFVAVNCAAVPDSLLLAELFGHVKGAFTDARQSRPGYFEQANGGTLFLDEVDSMPFGMQTALLRVLEERLVTRVGDTKSIPVNIRVVAATKRNLKDLVDEGRFREDLFYRLSVFDMSIPPLRERGTDITLLAEYFLQTLEPDIQDRPTVFSPEALDSLLAYPWPGNVRQLRHAVQRAILLETDSTISVTSLTLDHVANPPSQPTAVSEQTDAPLPPLSGLLPHGLLPITMGELQRYAGIKADNTLEYLTERKQWPFAVNISATSLRRHHLFYLAHPFLPLLFNNTAEGGIGSATLATQIRRSALNLYLDHPFRIYPLALLSMEPEVFHSQSELKRHLTDPNIKKFHSGHPLYLIHERNSQLLIPKSAANREQLIAQFNARLREWYTTFCRSIAPFMAQLSQQTCQVTDAVAM